MSPEFTCAIPNTYITENAAGTEEKEDQPLRAAQEARVPTILADGLRLEECHRRARFMLPVTHVPVCGFHAKRGVSSDGPPVPINPDLVWRDCGHRFDRRRG